MQKIHASIRDPQTDRFSFSAKRASLTVLHCQHPEGCELYTRESSCLLMGWGECKFGFCSHEEGPSPRAMKYRATVNEWKRLYAPIHDRLKYPTTTRRIFKINGYYYLPYDHMSSGNLSHPTAQSFPIQSKWVPEAEMTPELLERICRAQPMDRGYVTLKSYQAESVPKFIADLKCHFPDLFALLPEDQKARVRTMNFVGRKADLTTCPPGDYLFDGKVWRWDGELLHGTHMVFAPVKGEVTITIRPEPGSPVEITDNAQVTDKTRFLD